MAKNKFSLTFANELLDALYKIAESFIRVNPEWRDPERLHDLVARIGDTFDLVYLQQLKPEKPEEPEFLRRVAPLICAYVESDPEFQVPEALPMLLLNLMERVKLTGDE